MGSDLDIRLKKEAKNSLQLFRDQSLLRRKFGPAAVRFYELIDTGKTVSEIMSELSLDEQKLMEILEFMNNNAMVSVAGGQGAPRKSPPESGPSGAESGEEEGGAPESEEGAPEKEEEGEGEAAPAKEDSEPGPLSPLEKILYDKHGSLGVRIYNLIDGEKTAEEILRETGVSEAKLVEILEFMDEQGIIKLEKPEAKGAAEEEGAEEEAEGKEPEREPRFKPMIEEAPEEKPFEPPKSPAKQPPAKEQKKHDEAESEEDMLLVDVPTLAKLSLMQKAVLFAELSTKFGKGARQLVDLVDGKRDFLDLSLATHLSLFDIDAIMAYFGKKGFFTFRQLQRDEIKKKYGDDGFAIYKRYGRDGLLLYEMIGKEASLKDLIVKSRMEPDRAIDIVIFIHKVLGLDIPLDRNLIYRQLGMKK